MTTHLCVTAPHVTVIENVASVVVGVVAGGTVVAGTGVTAAGVAGGWITGGCVVGAGRVRCRKQRLEERGCGREPAVVDLVVAVRGVLVEVRLVQRGCRHRSLGSAFIQLYMPWMKVGLSPPTLYVAVAFTPSSAHSG